MKVYVVALRDGGEVTIGPGLDVGDVNHYADI